MIILNFVLGTFILLELFNVLALYFNPTMKQANAIGVFKAWNKSKQDSEVHNLIRYLTYWVAGTKLIFLCLLVVILVLGEVILKITSVLVLVISISSFYWKMYPLICKMDSNGEITPKGYSKTLGITIAIFILAFLLALLFILI